MSSFSSSIWPEQSSPAHLLVLVVVVVVPVQLPQYASTASVFQPERASTAPAVASQPGVTNKVSAWLQQTEDINATSNGRCHRRTVFQKL